VAGPPIRLGCRREQLDFARTAHDGVRHLVTNGLTFPRYLTHRVADVSAGSLMLFLGRVAKIARRARHPFAELGCRPRREVQREAGADHAARDDPD